MVVIVRGSNDDADKMLTAGSKSYTYDAAGRTTAVTSGGQTTNLYYDYESRLTQIVNSNNATNMFTYNGLDTRVGKSDSGGTKTYKRDGAGVTDAVLSDGNSAYTPGISVRTSGATKFMHSDFQKTVTSETSSAQATTATRTYDAFGLMVASSGSSASPFGFAGGYGYQEDPDSGLKLLGHRYYDPSTGRFLTRDPAKDGRNWYGYCENNPIKSVDPTGYGIWGFVGGVLTFAACVAFPEATIALIIIGGVTSAVGSYLDGDDPSTIIGNTIIGAATGPLKAVVGLILFGDASSYHWGY